MRPLDLLLADHMSLTYARHHMYEITKLVKPIVLTNAGRMVSVIMPYEEIKDLYRSLDEIRVAKGQIKEEL